MSSNLTLRQRYETTKQVKSTTPKSESPVRRELVDPLTKWLGSDVLVVFMSGRTLEGKLTALWRFDLEITDGEGTRNHVCKHAVERVRQRK